MTLVQSWIDSLTLLKPKNAQLFIMVTLKSIIESYKIMFYYWWWLIVLMVVCFVLPLVFPLQIFFMPFWALTQAILSYFFYGILFLAVCFITRPSIMKKDWPYFGAQYKKIIVYWLLLPIVAVLMSFALGQISTSLYFGYLMYWLLLPTYLGWKVFWVLFFADSAGGLKNFLLSLWNALKMIIFSLPLLLVIGIAFKVFVWLMSVLMWKIITWFIFDESIFWIARLIRSVLGNILAALFLPIGVCFYANIYIKKLHDQFDLYFPRF